MNQIVIPHLELVGDLSRLKKTSITILRALVDPGDLTPNRQLNNLVGLHT